MTQWRIVWLCLSLASLTPAVAGPAHSARALSDARLKELVEHLAGEEGTKAEAALRGAGLQRVLPRLTRLQRETPKNQELYIYLAFAFAYFGVDYQRNVRRLAALDELWMRGDARWQQYVSVGNDMRDSIPGLMATLYERNHDPGLLRTLFSWGLDGGPAEILAAEQVQLLTDYPLPVIRMMRQSPDREADALSSLCDGVGADPAEYRRAVRQLRQASRRADPSTRRYVRRFLRSAAARWKIGQGEKELRRADLERIDLRGADFTGLDLRGANLGQSDLRDANLRGAQLGGAILRDACYNRRTRWPKGFDPRRHRAVLVR